MPGRSPAIKITSTNATRVKKYEKFEVLLDVENAGIENPYDPEDIDVYAKFTTPSGRVIRINGFYDDYDNAGQWKVRFSPAEPGEYSYQLFVNRFPNIYIDNTPLLCKATCGRYRAFS